MVTGLALAMLTLADPPARRESEPTFRISRSRTIYKGRIIGVAAQGRSAMGNANVRRNGRPYGSIGVPAAGVVVDGERLAGAAMVMSGRVFVQMRPVFERLGASTT